MENRRIMFLGASGTGKTTLAKILSEKLDIPFVSSSLSDVAPSTKAETHTTMLDTASYQKELKYLSLRFKHISSIKGSFITDRSFFDNLAYLLFKVSKDIGECDVETFIETIHRCLDEAQITDIIYLPVTLDMMNDEWMVEDNGKRVTNKYFQYTITKVMDGIIPLMGPWDNKGAWDIRYDSTYMISQYIRGLRLMSLEEYSLDDRVAILTSYLK